MTLYRKTLWRFRKCKLILTVCASGCIFRFYYTKQSNNIHEFIVEIGQSLSKCLTQRVLSMMIHDDCAWDLDLIDRAKALVSVTFDLDWLQSSQTSSFLLTRSSRNPMLKTQWCSCMLWFANKWEVNNEWRVVHRQTSSLRRSKMSVSSTVSPEDSRAEARGGRVTRVEKRILLIRTRAIRCFNLEGGLWRRCFQVNIPPFLWKSSKSSSWKDLSQLWRSESRVLDSDDLEVWHMGLESMWNWWRCGGMHRFEIGILYNRAEETNWVLLCMKWQWAEVAHKRR
jgi:hypothetical protein